MDSLFLLQVAAAVSLDLLVGDPRWLPHPVRLIGMLCSRTERLLRGVFSSESIDGLATVAVVLTTVVTTVSAILTSAALLSPILAQFVAICILYQSIAARDLISHSKKVYMALQGGTLKEAREAVARIVGRDTDSLGRAGIVRACVETVAENMVDGVTAPLFYAIIFSLFAPFVGVDAILLAAIGAMFYKSINTMDSMIGYKNEQYLHFGCSAARLDDLVNFIPARISSLFLILAASLLFMDWKNSYTVYMLDRLNHTSPNAGHPEAAVAGALGVRLGGDSVYFGKLIKKPEIGLDKRKIETVDIIRTNHLMLLGSFVFLLWMLMIREILSIFFI